MSDAVIQIRDLGKRYTLGGQTRLDQTLPEMIARQCKRIFGRGNATPDAQRSTDFWALRHITFDVNQGDVIGVVGRNGAGKSTLLKILSQITDPTEGRAVLRGRVGSLLEVGTGFHPELTGHENIYLNGTILGMTRREIKSKFDQIVDFSGVEQFLETPVKRYSSGMIVRLAFAVAAHLDPELLLVDEVLAVGDAAFQKKCLAKMGEVASQGRTVLFVSHNMRAVRSLCDKGVYLHEGGIAAIGDIESVLDAYASDIGSDRFTLPLRADDVTIHRFDIAQGDRPTSMLNGALPIDIKVDFETHRALDNFRMGVYVKTNVGDTLFRSFLSDWDASRESIGSGRYRASLTIPEKYLMAGNYAVELHASRFGVVDYLTEHHMQHRVTVCAPADFNNAHMSERIDSLVLLNRRWEVSPSENAA